jgi:hypothetical protein
MMFLITKQMEVSMDLKLAQLQQLATERGIDIMKQGKTKLIRKTKAELVQELTTNPTRTLFKDEFNTIFNLLNVQDSLALCDSSTTYRRYCEEKSPTVWMEKFKQKME